MCVVAAGLLGSVECSIGPLDQNWGVLTGSQLRNLPGGLDTNLKSINIHTKLCSRGNLAILGFNHNTKS
jgi:hypothetical protein